MAKCFATWHLHGAEGLVWCSTNGAMTAAFLCHCTTMQRVRAVIWEVENWLAPGGGHGCRLKEGGGGVWEMDTCDRTYVWSSLSAFFFTMLYTL